MIKLFSTNKASSDAGHDLTKQFEEWLATQPNSIKIIGFHTTSNKYGWMLTIHYETNKEEYYQPPLDCFGIL